MVDNYIPLGYMNIFDKIFKKSSFIFVDKENTINHLVEFKYKIHKKFKHNPSQYELNVIKIDESHVDDLIEIMHKLNNALMIKEKNYAEDLESVMHCLEDYIMSYANDKHIKI